MNFAEESIQNITFHSFKSTAVEIRISKIRYYLLSILVLSSDPISIDSDQQKFDHENVEPKWDFHIIVVRSVFSKVNQSLTDSFCSWGWCHQSCMVMLMLTMRIEETVSQVVRRCNPHYWMLIYWIQKDVQFRVTCSFSLISESSAITSFLLRYPDLVSLAHFLSKSFIESHEIIMLSAESTGKKITQKCEIWARPTD